ncbi:MAG: hypothetical protein ABSD57_11450 [Verrucomicrobiota bacterium]|jgi:hypothetical protein
MKIKKIIPILLSASVSLFVSAQTDVPNTPQWQVTLHVTDEGGVPVAGANVFASYFIPPPPNATEAESRKTGTTDTNGIVILTAHSGPAIWYGAASPGYYSTASTEYDFDTRNKANGQWHPWNPTVTLALKKVVSPIPMYVNSVDVAHKKKPILDKPVGFDLTVGDWVAPFGKGTTPYMFFTWHEEHDTNASSNSGTRYNRGWESTLTISFPHDGDGIQEFDTSNPGDSELRSAQEAPLQGYSPTLVKIASWYPDRPATNTYNHLHKNYYLRVQTVLDENGNVKSAQYGKIYGDFDETVLTYLNPTPNSRDLEFDKKHNLGNAGIGGSVAY